MRRMGMGACAALVGALLAARGEEIVRLRLGHEDKGAHPWVYPAAGGGYEGLDLEFMGLLGKELGVEIELAAYPWQRCLILMGEGQLDGAFASSYKEDRERFGEYPRGADGKPDADKRIHTSGYSLYARKGAGIGFDGKKMTGLGDGKVGVQRGFSIVKDFDRLGIPYDDGTNDPEVLFRKLKLGRNPAVAVQTERAAAVLAADASLGDVERIELDVEPFRPKPYYAMLSRQVLAREPGFGERFWRAAEKVRKGEEYRKAAARYGVMGEP